MSKSLKTLLRDSAELIDMAGITHAEAVDVSVFCRSIMIHLKPMALAKVFRDFDMPRSKLKTRLGGSGDLHVSFGFKGATWTCVVMAPDIAKWQAITGQTAARITSANGRHLRQPPTAKPLALAAPAAKMRCLPAPPPAATAVAEKPPTMPGQRTLFTQ